MHRMWEGPGGKDSEMRQVPTAQEKAGYQKEDPEGVKATIPDGEHPFDYLFEGHQFLMAGCLLLEEIDSPLEEIELEQIRKLLDSADLAIGILTISSRLL